MEADIHTLYTSDFYQVLDFKCRCTDCITSKPEYSSAFTVSFVRKGNFLFNVFRNSLDSYTGCVLVTKPGYERTVTHTHAIPDECTIFEFKQPFYDEVLAFHGKRKFFFDNDLHSTLVKTDAATEFLHYHIIHRILSRSGSKLEIDHCVMDVVESVLQVATDYTPDLRINARLKKNHLVTIESAKAYMTSHFMEDISLSQIANHCCVSPFHFSRIFKTFSGYAPHRFLLDIRLKNAEVILKNTALPVADVAFASGFNSIEYFTATFRQKYQSPPAAYRHHRGLRPEKSKIS